MSKDCRHAIGFGLIARCSPSLLVLWDRWHRRRGHEIAHVSLAEEERELTTV